MAQLLSAAITASNARIAAPNSNEWSSATARSSRGATAGAHDVGKWTVPSFSLACEARWSCAAAGRAGANAASAIAQSARGTRVMSEHVFEVKQEAAEFRAGAQVGGRMRSRDSSLRECDCRGARPCDDEMAK